MIKFCILFIIVLSTQSVAESRSYDIGLNIVIPGSTESIDKLSEEWPLQESGFNIIRFNINQHLWSKTFKVDLLTAENQIIRLVKQSIKKYPEKKYIINFSRPSIPVNKPSKFFKSSAFWSNEEHMASAASFFQRVMSAFSEHQNSIYAFDFVSEPMEKGVGAPPRWYPLFLKISEIRDRTVPGTHLVFSPGPGGAGKAFSDRRVTDLLANVTNVICGIHFYWPHSYTLQGIAGRAGGKKFPRRDLTVVELGRKVDAALRRIPDGCPILVGEFGAVKNAEGRDAYLNTVADIFSKRKVSHIFYSAGSRKYWGCENVIGTDFGTLRFECE